MSGAEESSAVIRSVSLCLAHVPDLIPYGSKPSRDTRTDDDLLPLLKAHRRGYKEALTYPPNQVFIGNVTPQELWELPEPWYQNGVPEANRYGPHGEIMPEDEFYFFMKACDDFDLLLLTGDFTTSVSETIQGHPLVRPGDLESVGTGQSQDDVRGKVESGAGIPLYVDDQLVGCLLHGHPEDASLHAEVLLENLACKTSAVLSLRHALERADGLASADVQYLLGCGEEAVGDRYQRGGGSLSKAIGEKAGCMSASGSDVKAFCCGPNHAIVIGASLIKAGLFETVVIVGGGSLSKLGMKYQGHLKHDMPILEDVLASIAVVVGRDDGYSPVVDLTCVGKHNIGAGSSQQAIADAIVVEPLTSSGLRLVDVDRFATELHNPEVTLPQGSGNVPKTNYRVLASLAARRNEIMADEIESFVRQRGMPGFSPTQGHIASAVPYLAHARDELTTGTINSAFFYAKGSLFLGRMTKLSDGISFLLKRNANVSHNPIAEEKS